ncbi:hypothetical protein PIB30_066869 [Stylosanthes scabra]|uniref:Uncharacterized protein n=1 Tax=Stylosanthes scabra TaxID=79078 RepID=A0ABU6ZL69_9FABA|nr:hypothetical protein [Stylosanthes scabra]
MGRGVVFYEYEALKEYDDVDVESAVELGTIKIQRYYFKDEKFTGSPLPTKDSASSGLSLRTYPLYDWKATRSWSLPPLGSNFIVSSEGWMCEGDETKVEETQGLDGVKSEGFKVIRGLVFSSRSESSERSLVQNMVFSSRFESVACLTRC